MKTVAEMTVDELKELIRQVVAEQREYFLDGDGWLVFTNGEAYARYLERHPDKMPSELEACYIDEHGVKAYYSDYELTEEGLRRVEEGWLQIAEGKFVTLEESRRRRMVREGKARKKAI